jgi:hypothetical protein
MRARAMRAIRLLSLARVGLNGSEGQSAGGETSISSGVWSALIVQTTAARRIVAAGIGLMKMRAQWRADFSLIET